MEESQSTALTESATARSTTQFLPAEGDMLGEGEMQNRCAAWLSIFEDVAGNPGIRKKRRPVTPCVPARRD
jgi:hypothetical protein